MLDVITSTATIVNPQVTSALHGVFATAFETGLLLLVSGGVWLAKLGINSIKNRLIRAFASRAVAFAAQRLPDLSNDEKRAEVARRIHAKFSRLSQDEIDHYLEEAYVNLKSGLAVAPTA